MQQFCDLAEEIRSLNCDMYFDDVYILAVYAKIFIKKSKKLDFGYTTAKQ
jgi:hypothetical protein